MRTRFLATDYFSSSASSSSSSDQTLTIAAFRFAFLPLAPPLPDPHISLPSAAIAGLPAADIAVDELDALPIAAALSDFFAAVLPRSLPLATTEDEGLDDFLCEKDWTVEGFRPSGSIASKIPQGLDGISYENEGKREGSRSDGSDASPIPKGWELWKEIKFEVVEAELLLGEVASFHSEEADSVVLLFTIPDVKIPLDFVDIEVGTTIRYASELVEPICQVENIPAKSNDDQDYSSAGDSNCSTTALDHGVRVPQFEVSGNSWEIDECLNQTEISNIFLQLVQWLDGARGQDSVVNMTELLRSTDMDMLAYICEDPPSEDSREDEPTVKSAVELDLVRINDNILLERGSAVYPIKPDGTCSDLPCSILFQEVEIIDFPLGDALKMLVQLETAGIDVSDQMFKVDLDPARDLYESMVSSDLALVDDMFKSLPTPILNDHKAIWPALLPIAEVLCCLPPHPLSACDGIYLDWHLLLEESCNHEICSTYASMVEGVNSYSLTPEQQICYQQASAINIDFLEDFQRSTRLNDEDKQNEIYVLETLSHDPPAKLETTLKYKHETSARGHFQMENLNSEKASSLFESMSQSNGLNFFLDVRRGTKTRTNNENSRSLDAITPSKGPVVPSLGPKVKSLKEVVEIHPISLSEPILGLINHIHKSYTSAFEENTFLRNSFSDGEGLNISKQKLLELITGEGSKGFYSHCKDEDKMDLVVLYALKQVAYYLCFFGLHAAHLYISNLAGSFGNIPERLINIQCFIGEARWKAEKQLSESHPSLSDIENILISKTQTGQKILIVAERAFWLPLSQKLTSIKMTFVELRKFPSAAHLDPVNNTVSTNCVLEIPQSDCILLDINNIPDSFPFNKFGTVLEYGGPNQSSTLLSLASKIDGLPPLHFLYVKGGIKDLPVALFEGYHTAQHLKSTLDEVLDTLQKDLQEKMNKMRIVDSLNFVPATDQLQDLQEVLNKERSVDSLQILTSADQLHKLENLKKKNIVDPLNFVLPSDQLNIQETFSKTNIADSLNFVTAAEKSSSVSSVSANLRKASGDNQSAMDFPDSMKFDSVKSTRSSAPEVVIIVNTKSHEKDMLFSRRSTYQQILALEKQGAQVVEREIDLPVDLIFSAAVCLVWYETRALGSNALTTAADASGLATSIENIATNVLMSLSFSFTSCIMVFEGENHFLSAVTGSSDALYAAAASLDLNLQLFFAHTPESTDEIILSCIRKANRLYHGLYPAMPESESLAESFLTRFPSVNPLSAHMILSSVGTLVDFLSWSHEHRIQAVGKYLLSPESISLFSSLCRFGDLGESKSVMTECSSVDSDISSTFLQSPGKRKKRTLQAFAVPTNDPLCRDPANQLSGGYLEHDRVLSPPKLRKFSVIDDITLNPQELFMFGRSLNNGIEGGFCEPRNYDVDTIVGNQLNNYDFRDELAPKMNKSNERSDNVMGTSSFSWQPESGSKPPVRSALHRSRLAFSGTCSRPIFPTSLEINDDAVDWSTLGGTNQMIDSHAYGDVVGSSCRDDVCNQHHELTEEIAQDPIGSLAFLKQDFDRHATSHGSDWEIDYLRQMNENRRARKVRASCDTSATSTNSRTKGGPYKIRSPSMLGTFRHQGETPSRNESLSIGTDKYRKGREGIKPQNQKVKKDSNVQPRSTRGKRKNPSFNPTWTPVDKRARQKLLFATYGNEKQSKLVWRHKSSPGIGCSLPKRYRDEGT